MTTKWSDPVDRIDNFWVPEEDREDNRNNRIEFDAQFWFEGFVLLFGLVMIFVLCRVGAWLMVDCWGF